jgi:hypothetical protein
LGELESQKLYGIVPSVVDRDALTQPQRHRGTEAIFSAGSTRIIQRRAKRVLGGEKVIVVDTSVVLASHPYC